jgi:hypothetical protein
MIEPGATADRPSRINPLQSDLALFDMYMHALNQALRQPEVRSAFDEFGISAGIVRNAMVGDAARILNAAPPEFAAYTAAVALDAASTGPVQVTHGSAREPLDMLRRMRAAWTIAAVLITVGGIAGSTAWHPMLTLADTGGALLLVAGLMWAAPIFIADTNSLFWKYGVLRLRTGRPSSGLHDPVRVSSAAVDLARLQLMAAIGDTEMLAQVRTVINKVRQDRFGPEYSVTVTPGLSEVYDNVNRVPTGVADELNGLLTRFDGASIGVAGPRGAGKSMLIREYCDPDSAEEAEDTDLDWSWLWGYSLRRRPGADLRCLVAAPVDYAPRDFVLHLFAAFCRSVTDSYDRQAGSLPRIVLGVFWLRRLVWLLPTLIGRAVLFGGAATALLVWKHAVAHSLAVPRAWVGYAAFAVIGVGVLSLAGSAAGQIRQVRQAQARGEKSFAAAARKHLARVRYLQTFTSGWSGSLNLPGGGSSGQYARGIARAEQPLSYPEIVDEFRDFARDVAGDMHRHGGRVFIGVDELDKIGSAEQAERFLNEIKGIFGIPHLYFMVSVSDDALTAFERRGLPLRDAFDSSFDEIVHVGPLSYLESRRLLYRRVIGLSEPYVALCHCLGGGLARDVIRAARQVVRAATALTTPVAEPAVDPIYDGLTRPTAYLPLLPDVLPPQPPTLTVISAAVIRDELRRKLRAVGQVIGSVTKASAKDLHETLFQVSHALDLGQPVIAIIDLLAKPGPEEPAAIRALRLDFAAYTYFCATMDEVFTNQLNHLAMIEATGATPGSGSFDALAAARNAFALDTHLAWRMVTGFRKAWSLETRELGM